MPRPQNTEQRRAQIVGGLARVMAARGYAKATIQEIAREAGLSPGLVHYHFGSKQEILLALIESLGSIVRARLDSQAPDPAERLFAAIDAIVGTEQGIDSDAVACWVVIGAEAVRQPEVRRLYERLMREAIDELADAFGEAMRKRGRSDASARAAALSVVASIEGFFRLAAGAPSVVPHGSAAVSIRESAARLIEAAEVTRP